MQSGHFPVFKCECWHLDLKNLQQEINSKKQKKKKKKSARQREREEQHTLSLTYTGHCDGVHILHWFSIFQIQSAGILSSRLRGHREHYSGCDPAQNSSWLQNTSRILNIRPLYRFNLRSFWVHTTEIQSGAGWLGVSWGGNRQTDDERGEMNAKG